MKFIPLRSTMVKFVRKMAKYNKVETPDLTPLRSTTVKFVLKMAKYNKVEIPDLTPLRSTTVKFVRKMDQVFLLYYILPFSVQTLP
jgi:hypothetical protein